MRNKYEAHEHYVSRANPTSGRTYNTDRNGGTLVTYDANEEPISYREVFVDGPPDQVDVAVLLDPADPTPHDRTAERATRGPS